MTITVFPQFAKIYNPECGEVRTYVECHADLPNNAKWKFDVIVNAAVHYSGVLNQL